MLEKKPRGSNKWQKCPGTIGPNDTQATAKNLDDGEEYDFRVMAVNENGESEPLLTSGPIKAKFPFGRIFLKMSMIVFLEINIRVGKCNIFIYILVHQKGFQVRHGQ